MGIVLDTVNLSDRSKYQYTEGAEQPNYKISIKPGCTDGFPNVEEFTPVYWVRPYRILSKGADENTMFANQNAVLAAVKDARSRLRTNPVYLIRTVRSQTTPHIWTVLGAVPGRDMQHWDGIYKSWLDLALYVWPGMRIPEGLL